MIRRESSRDSGSVQGYHTAALAIANSLRQAAKSTGGGVTWEVRDTADRNGTRTRLASGDLYQGTSGIAVFLATAASVTALAEYRDAIFGALTYSREGGWPRGSGLLQGRLGVAYAHLLCSELLRDDGLWRLAREAFAVCVRESDSFVGSDYLDGAAGAISPLLTAATLLSLPEARALAIRLGDKLCETALRRPQGWSWESPNAIALDDLVGFSHGTTGISHALTELWRVTGKARFAHAAYQAIRYERTHFDARTRNWLDLRDVEIGEYAFDRNALRRDVYRGTRLHSRARNTMFAWCHGAPGVALARAHMCRTTHDRQLFAEGAIALATTVRHLEESKSTVSLCHGLIGNAVLAHSTAKLLARQSMEARVRRVVSQAVETYGREPDTWPLHPGGTRDASLMVGLAGVGLGLLAMAGNPIADILAATARSRSFDSSPGRARAWRRIVAATDSDSRQGSVRGRSAEEQARWELLHLGTGSARQLGRIALTCSYEEFIQSNGSLHLAHAVKLVPRSVAKVQSDKRCWCLVKFESRNIHSMSISKGLALVLRLLRGGRSLQHICDIVNANAPNARVASREALGKVLYQLYRDRWIDFDNDYLDLGSGVSQLRSNGSVT